MNIEKYKPAQLNIETIHARPIAKPPTRQELEVLRELQSYQTNQTFSKLIFIGFVGALGLILIGFLSTLFRPPTVINPNCQSNCTALK